MIANHLIDQVSNLEYFQSQPRQPIDSGLYKFSNFAKSIAQIFVHALAFDHRRFINMSPCNIKYPFNEEEDHN